LKSLTNKRKSAPYKRARNAVHLLVAVFASMLAFILAGLVLHFGIQAEVFFGLSFALLGFAIAQALYELGPNSFVFFFLATTVIGYVAEVLGTNFGFPFGRYRYTDFLGAKELGVPVVVPLVWFVIAYLTFSIAFSASQQLSVKELGMGTIFGLCALAAFGSVAWDLLIDPMFTSYGYWVWGTQVIPAPKIAGIPITNFVGWFIVVFLMLAILSFVLLQRRRRTKATSSAGKLLRRTNTWDSRIVYCLLLVDGAVANLSLPNNSVAVMIGVPSMLAFLVVAFFAVRAPVTKRDDRSLSQSH
jgi:uncharacterized membrane protein